MDKEKKKRERKDKKEKKEAVKKALQEQKTNKEEKVNEPNFNVNVPINFEFLCSIYNLLLTSNSRIHWEPDELIPIGMTLRDLKGMVAYYENAIKQKNKESNEGNSENQENSNLSTSASQPPSTS
tara:strand:+ start:3966 stop:4340 length:375 start_codon:yes stop_codon:yes gene_type:complete